MKKHDRSVYFNDQEIRDLNSAIWFTMENFERDLFFGKNKKGCKKLKTDLHKIQLRLFQIILTTNE